MTNLSNMIHSLIEPMVYLLLPVDTLQHKERTQIVTKQTTHERTDHGIR